MFASWKKAAPAVVTAHAIAAAALLSAPSAEALEGIQGRHAIFYPSLELIYQHDDNFFLSPTDERSADLFMARAHFVLEVPGARQYLRLHYSPMYRDVDASPAPGFEYQLPDSVSHFWDLDAHLQGSSIFSVDIGHQFTLGNLQTFEIDPAGDPLVGQELYASDARFWANDITVDFNWEGSRQGATLMLGHHATEFDDSDPDKLPDWYELDEVDFGIKYFYKFTPLTNFNIGFRHASSTLDWTQLTREDVFGIAIPETDADRSELFVGFEGELGRTTTGSAELSLLSLGVDNPPARPDGSEAEGDFDGINVRASVTKAFSRWSKLAFTAARQANFSAFDLNSFYTANIATVQFTNQPQGARVGWLVGGGFQRNSYDEESAVDGTGAVFAEREDDITYLRAEVGYHPLEHLSLRLNYRHEERESSIDRFNYDDNVWIFQVQLGF